MEIFPNLPDDLGRQCLLRVSFKFHDNLRAVCKRWRDELISRRFFQDRLRREEVIVMLIDDDRNGCGIVMYDPADNWCGRLPSIPTEFKLYYRGIIRCVSVSHKLVVLGFMKGKSAADAVCIYDFRSGKWYRGADMPHCRYSFDCRASPDQGQIYVCGGHYKHNRSKPYTAVYHVEENRWTKLNGEMGREHVHRISGDGWVFIDGLKYELSDFEQTATISNLEKMRFEGCCRCVAVSGRLYLFNSEGVKIYPTLEEEEHERSAIQQFPHTFPVIYAVLCGDRNCIFVIADGYEPYNKGFFLFRPFSEYPTWTALKKPQLLKHRANLNWGISSMKI